MPNADFNSSHSVDKCQCLFCHGEKGLKLVAVSHDIAVASGLVALGRKDKVTIKSTDQIFVVEGHKAIACVRFLYRRLARLCGCWVDSSLRGQGLGEFMVRCRIDYVEKHTSVRRIDTFAFRPRLFLDLGFEKRQGFKIGTTLLRKVVDR